MTSAMNDAFVQYLFVPVLTAISALIGGWLLTLVPGPARRALDASATKSEADTHARDVAVLVGAGVLSLLVGARWVPVEAVWDAGHPLRPIVEVRLERTLLGFAVGAALGLAGALMQGLTRNPLADPGILGVNAGATFAMVVGMTAFALIILNGVILGRPGDPDSEIDIKIGYIVGLIGAGMICAGGIIRQAEGERARKPPGTI